MHDSILVECPRKNAKAVQEIMKNCMESKYKIQGKMRSFPVDFKVGTNWGEMIEQKED